MATYGSGNQRPKKKVVQKARPINGRKMTKAEQLEATKRRNKRTAPAMNKLLAGRGKKKGLAKPNSSTLSPSRLKARDAKEAADKEASRKRRATKKALANRNR